MWTPIVESIRTGTPKTTSAPSALSTTRASPRWRPLLKILSKWAGGKLWKYEDKQLNVKRLIFAKDFCSSWIRRLGLGKSKVQRLHSHVGDSIQQVPLELDLNFSKYGIHQQSSMFVPPIYMKFSWSESKISWDGHISETMWKVVFAVLWIQVTRRMFANLSTEVASRVKRFYNLDLRMFGYKPYPSI